MRNKNTQTFVCLKPTKTLFVLKGQLMQTQGIIVLVIIPNFRKKYSRFLMLLVWILNSDKEYLLDTLKQISSYSSFKSLVYFNSRQKEHTWNFY